MQFLIQNMDIERHLGLGSLDPFKVPLPVFVEVLESLPSAAALSVLYSYISSIFPKPYSCNRLVCVCVRLTKDLTK